MPGVEAVVLDIEGTVISISFVKDELFPFARRNVRAYLEAHWGDPELMAIVSQLHTQACRDAAEDGPPVGNPEETPAEALRCQLEANVLWQMDADRKAAPLKALQGLLWKEGYASGQLRAPLYPDVVPALTAWKSQHRGLFIYSSGSVQAQRLLFGHTTEGDLTGLLDGYFDISTAGAKTDAQSYGAISRATGREPSRILFLTDVAAEVAHHPAEQPLLQFGRHTLCGSLCCSSVAHLPCLSGSQLFHGATTTATLGGSHRKLVMPIREIAVREEKGGGDAIHRQHLEAPVHFEGYFHMGHGGKFGLQHELQLARGFKGGTN